MSFRLPSQNKAFKPTKPAVRRPAPKQAGPSGTPGSSASSQAGPSRTTHSQAGPSSQGGRPRTGGPGPSPGPASSPSQVPDLTQSSTQSTLTVLGTPTPTPTPNQQSAKSSQDFAVPAAPKSKPAKSSLPPTVGFTPQPSTPRTATPSGPKASVPPSPRGRQSSLAPSTASSVLRSGKSALLAAAESQAASGFSKPSPGRIDAKPRPKTAAPPAESASAVPMTPATLPTSTGLPVTPQSLGIPPTISTSSGLPPTIATITPDNFKSNRLPPTIATGSGLPPTAGPSNFATLDARAQAEAIVAGIQRVRGSPRPKARRVGKRDEENRGIIISKRTFKDTTTKTINKKRKGTSEDGVEDEEDGGPEGDAASTAGMGGDGGLVVTRPRRGRRRTKEDGETPEAEDGVITKRVGRKRGPYKSAGLAGTLMDRRLTANKKKRTEDGAKLVSVNLDNVEAGDMVGEEVDVNVLTMGELATNATSGRVSARALKLNQFTREVALQKKRAMLAKRMAEYQRSQIQRRKLRSTRNQDRARRRAEFTAKGQDPVEFVSADEDDSDEEYETVPDRLTPPPEPERVTRVEPMRIGPQPEHVESAAIDTFVPPDMEEGEEFELPDWAYEDVPAEQRGQGEEGDGEDDLQRAGISVVDPDANGVDHQWENGQGDEDEDGDEDEEPDWNQFQTDRYDADAYRDDIAEQQRRNMEEYESRTVVEEDDETKMVNARTYSRFRHTERWSQQETDLFYAVLPETGLNPTMLKPYFPGRTQKQLKNKMNRELQRDPAKVNAALDQRREIDIEYLKKSAGYDPDRGWEREDALLEEARRDQERLRHGGMDLEEAAVVLETGGEEGGEDVELKDVDEDGDEVYVQGDLLVDGGAGYDAADPPADEDEDEDEDANDG